MKRGTRFLFLLLVAANAQKVVENFSNGDLKRQLNQIENEQTFDNYRMKAVMNRILQSVEANNKKLEVAMKEARDDKLEMKASMDRNLQSDEAIKKQIEDLMMKVQPVKERDCQKTLASWSLIERNATKFFKTMGRTFYYNSTQWATWYKTRDWCSSRGMQLATLKTAEEIKQVANALYSKISSDDYWFWVSASDIGRKEGQFHWADGTPVLNTTWSSGEPDHYKTNQETCTLIRTGFEKLRDAPCSNRVFTLCEVPELLATCL